MSINRWYKIRSKFRNVALQVYGLSPTPLLHIALSTGLTSFKTRECVYGTTKTSVCGHVSRSQNPVNRKLVQSKAASITSQYCTYCPSCQSGNLGTLARNVPMNRHIQSKLKCRITGKSMDDTNPPVCLPNGMVYSEEIRFCWH